MTWQLFAAPRRYAHNNEQAASQRGKELKNTLFSFLDFFSIYK